MNSKEPQNYGWDGQNVQENQTKTTPEHSLLHNADINYQDNLYHYIYQETTAAICVIEVSITGKYFYLDFNPMCKVLWGRATENLRGKSPQEIFPEPDVEQVLAKYEACVRSQQIISYEEYIFLENERNCWRTTLKPQINSNGQVKLLISTSVRISQPQPIETAIKIPHLNLSLEAKVQQPAAQLQSTLAQLKQALQSEELVRSITQAIRDTLDEKQVLQTAARSLTEALSIECCQIELYKYHHTITEVICEYPIVLPDEQGIHRQVKDYPELYVRLLKKESVHFVDWLPTVGYRQQQVTRLICPIFDDRGILGNLWLMRPKESMFEAEEIKLVEQIADQCAIAIRQARLYQAEQIQVKELEKLNLVKDDFLKTISHELRTPMSRLRLAISTLENLLEVEIGAHNSARINKVMQIFHASFKKQNQLIDDLLTLCYVNAASKPDLWQSIDLITWIPQIVKTFALGTNRQAVQLDLAPELPTLHCDPKMLKRIINELLNNADKYTPTEGVIILRTEKTLTQLLIKVINTDVEIPVEEQEKIFDKFYRIPNSDPWQHGGTGIGLALVKKLVELLSGEIIVTSQDQTTIFTLAFALN